MMSRIPTSGHRHSFCRRRSHAVRNNIMRMMHCMMRMVLWRLYWMVTSVYMIGIWIVGDIWRYHSSTNRSIHRSDHVLLSSALSCK